MFACVCVCVCERERLFLLSRRKEGSKCLIVNIAFYFHLYYLFTVQQRQDRTGTRTGSQLHQCYIHSYKHFFLYTYIYIYIYIYITNRQKMWFNVTLNSKIICPCK